MSRTPAHRPTTPDYQPNSFDQEWNQIGGGASSSLPGNASPFHGVGSSGVGGGGGFGGEAQYGGFMGNSFGSGSGIGSNPFANTGGDLDLGGGGMGGFGGVSPASTADASPAGGFSTLSDSAGLNSATWTPTTPTGAESLTTGSNTGAGSVAGGSVAGDVPEDPPLPENIQVKLAADGRKGVIVEMRPGLNPMYVVQMADNGESLTLTRDELEVVRPAKKDKLIILRGDLAGQTGTLIGIDSADGIVKMAANSDIKILDLDFCAKLGDGLG